MSNAQAHKDKGNEAFKKGQYADAVGFYSAAIVADRKEPTYPLNRAAAYLKLGKYEDAERDCTTVLTLKPAHPKALFRRGQARVGLEHYADARKDFAVALELAPQDKDIAKAMEEVDEKIKAKAKKATIPRDVNSVPAPRRRRVPIEIVDSPASTATQPSISPDGSSPSAELKAVSSRTLTPSTSTTPSLPSSTSSTSTISTTVPEKAPPKPKSTPPTPAPFARVDVNPLPASQTSSFKEAKQTRDNNRPSRVGGGIFRPNGESKLFPTREVTPSSAPTPGSPQQAVEVTSKPQIKAPATFSDLVKRWTTLKTPEEQWALLSKIPPSQFPYFCKSALEPTFLASIFQTLHAVLDKADLNTQIAIRSFLEYLPLVSRFNTIFLFLSKAERETAKGVWSRLGVDLEELEGAWASLLK